MATNVFGVRQLLYAAESTTLENAGDAQSDPSWGDSLPVFDISADLRQERIPDAAIQSRLSHAAPGHPGVRTATLTFSCYALGNLTTAASSVTETWQGVLLKRALGGEATTAGTTVSSATSASSITFASTASFAVGEAIRMGTKSDGQGDGQFGIIGTVGPPTVMLTAFPGQPDASDVCYACGTIYHDESASVLTERFLVMHDTTGAQFALFGCVPTSIVYNIPVGPSALPTITFTYEAGYWRTISTTFPNSTARANDYCAPVAGGSFFIQDVGTVTRATYTPAEINLSLGLKFEPIYGPPNTSGGAWQNITGWTKTGMGAMLEVKRPWDATPATFWDSENSTITYKQILFTANPTDGRAWGFYMPRVMPAGNRGSGVVNVNNQNYSTETFQAVEGPTTTNELTRSSIRILWS